MSEEPAAALPIRLARATDMPAVIELARALAEFEKLAGPDDAAAQRLTEDFARGDRFQLLVASDGGQEGARLIAYAMYFFTYSSFLARPSLYLEDVFVLPQFRGRGVGERMLIQLAAEAERRGCGRFEWTVLDWNVSAQRFYERLGATVLPDWRICRAHGDALLSLARRT